MQTNEHAKADSYADSVVTYLGLGVSRLADASSSLVRWKPSMDQAIGAFGRQALPMVWDFAESNAFNEAAGDLITSIGTIAKVIDRLVIGPIGQVEQLDAMAARDFSAQPVIATDPPYYDNISYADLSDYFYIWLRKCLYSTNPRLFSTVVTPKATELIAARYRHEGSRSAAQEFFEHGLGMAFQHMRQLHPTDYPLSVFYAFKQTETEDDDSTIQETVASTGWETMLTGLIGAGLMILGTWPLRTELGNRIVGAGKNALASSILLSCRPRTSDAPIATRREFIGALRNELPEALKSLRHGNIAPVDMAQSAIGPGMAVFTKYAKVIEADGSPMTVRSALGIINQVLDEVLAEQEGDFDADTRWALAWFEQFGMNEESFGTAETLSKAKNTAVNALEEAGILKTKGLKGKVRLLRRDELPDDWDPVTDSRLRHWEIVQHLIRTLETKGEAEAAKLLNRLGGMGETARELAYRLYSICERKKWAEEALAYNGLVIAWPELSKLALSTRMRQPATQSELFS